MTCLQSILTCIFDTCIFVFLAESDSKEECQLLKKFRKLFGIKDVKQQIVCLKEVKNILKLIVCLLFIFPWSSCPNHIHLRLQSVPSIYAFSAIPATV